MLSGHSYNEKELLRQIADGNEKAFQQFFSTYWRKIYSITLLYAKVPEIAEDATQEVFLQIWKKRSELPDVAKLEGYLFTIAKHIIFNIIRKRVFSGDADTYLSEYFADTDATPAHQLEIKEINRILESGVRLLTPQQEKVFRLSRFQGLSHAEIATELGLSKRTVKNYMISALQSLRTYLNSQSEDPHLLLIFLFTVLNK